MADLRRRLERLERNVRPRGGGRCPACGGALPATWLDMVRLAEADGAICVCDGSPWMELLRNDEAAGGEGW
ncbi:MAG: hypothetical protein HSCHL_1634 [Hydrogenibacillus schlegelii]|uniref:Uncharacterized protein n=1 Tax=Hydrogenibacillus schlegelii TaxID=1484 RepID=A0A2T5G4A5_HYDSH|nr:hypothetical protein [Hydrogenibacillus schlegelii]PTQ51026.1 MAG: hypothetical protein HSCHL_1634 [Hydrogenibacillus schlegelii]